MEGAQMDPSGGGEGGLAEAGNPKRPELIQTAQEGIAHVEAAYKEIDERMERHLEHFDKMLERMRENYRSQLLQAKTEAREYVESAVERWRETSDEIVTCHSTLGKSKDLIGMFSSAVQTGRYNLGDDLPEM